jgi:hypothetical protein
MKMFKKLQVLLFLGAMLFAYGCASVSSPVMGSLFTDVKGPITATQETSAGKTGKACATGILGLVATGDASIDAAKKAGGVIQVSSVDHSSKSILGIWTEFCTIVNGK